MKNCIKKININDERLYANVYKLTLAENGENIFNGSRGASMQDCNKLARTYVLAIFDSRFASIANAADCASFSCPTTTRAYVHYAKIDNCRDYQYFCTRCGTLLTTEEAATHDCVAMCDTCGKVLSAEEKRIGRCLACQLKRYATVYGYHGTPTDMREPRFTSPDMRAKKLHLGTELEFCTTTNGNRAALAKKLAAILNPTPLAYNDLHFETDGSLCGDGFEMITNPMTLREFRKRADMYQQAYDYIKEHNGTMVGAGAHIHIDRKFFGAESLAYGCYMGAYVAKYWEELFKKLAGGATNGYSTPIRYTGGSVLLYAHQFINEARGHYTAINLENRNTIEFRFWRGTFNWKQNLAYMDITQALCMWAKQRNDNNFFKCKPADLFKYCQAPAITWEYVKASITDTDLLAEIRHALDVCDGTDWE